MDYEFRRNQLTGSIAVSLSMDHEAFGVWLTDELGCELDAISAMIAKVESTIADGGEWQHAGKDYHLTLNQEEALVQANALFLEMEQDDALAQQDLSLYEQESYALCGSDDFLALLNAWRDFVVRR